MRIPPLLSDCLGLREPSSHGIYNSLSPWIWNWHGQSLLTCCDEMESSAHTQQSYTRMRLSLKSGLKIKFAGSKLAPRKVVHLLGSWDTARRAGQGQQCVSRVCVEPQVLFYMSQAPVETRDRCCVGELNIKADVLSVLIRAVFTGQCSFPLGSASFQAVCGQTLHQFDQFSL